MKIKVSDYIGTFLHAQGVQYIFEVIGGMITHIIDAIHRKGKITIISTHHEQAAAFAAEGMARMTGIPGVALATSGPGATNLLTGIGSCYFDSVPAVFITGQVNRNELKKNRSIRQLGFQETDIVSIVRPITKAAWLVVEPEEIPSLMAKAFSLALSGRPGPVLLDIPMDVQRSEITATKPVSLNYSVPLDFDPQCVVSIFKNLEAAQRPLILAGGGLRSARATDLFRSLVEQLKIPVVNSLMAVDVLPYSHPFRVGMIGTYGNRWANKAVGLSDVLLVLGSRLDIRQTGSDTEGFKGNRIIHHVDVEAGEINNRVTGCFNIISDLRVFLSEALRYTTEREFPPRKAWLSEITELKRAWPDTRELRNISGINPNEFMHELSACSDSAVAYVVDVGQHQMWAAQSLELGPQQRFVTSGGMGAMGFALPTAIGVSLACSGQPVVVVAGDGGFQLNLQELQTVVHNSLPIKIVVMNNECYGMVRQFQQSYFEERYQSTCWGYSSPDFAKVAQAYGISSCTVRTPKEITPALIRMWTNPRIPFLLQVMVDRLTNVYPKIAFGLPLTEMEPFVKPIDIEGT